MMSNNDAGAAAQPTPPQIFIRIGSPTEFSSTVADNMEQQEQLQKKREGNAITLSPIRNKAKPSRPSPLFLTAASSPSARSRNASPLNKSKSRNRKSSRNSSQGGRDSIGKDRKNLKGTADELIISPIKTSGVYLRPSSSSRSRPDSPHKGQQRTRPVSAPMKRKDKLPLLAISLFPPQRPQSASAAQSKQISRPEQTAFEAAVREAKRDTRASEEKKRANATAALLRGSFQEVLYILSTSKNQDHPTNYALQGAACLGK